MKVELDVPDEAEFLCLGIVIWAVLDRSQKPTDVGCDQKSVPMVVRASIQSAQPDDEPQNLVLYIAATRKALDEFECSIKRRHS